jgi:hypothetical protein
LNAEKCELSQPFLKFLGHVIDKDEVHADPEKTAAICWTTAPQSVSDLRRFMGMVNQMGPSRITERQTSVTLGSRAGSCLQSTQGRAAKAVLILLLYDTAARSKVSADASFGLGAVLLQSKEEGGWKPVAYASRT